MRSTTSPLVSLSPDKIATLRGFLDSSEFRPRYSFFVTVAELLDITDESAAKLCTFVNHVQSQREKRGKDGSSVPDELESFLVRASKKRELREEARRLIPYLKANREAFATLFTDRPRHDLSEKVRGLETGPLPHLHKFRTYLDVRPVYNADATEIVEYRTLITLGLTIHSTTSGDFEEVVVQLVEDDLAELRAQFSRLDNKLSVLKKKAPLGGQPGREGAP